MIYSLRKRLPENIKILRQINLVSVDRTLRVIKPNLAPILHFPPSAITKIEMQWKNITLVPWNQKEHTSEFWAEVLNYKDAGGNNPFMELSNFACSMLCLPFPNAEVERVFSQMNLVKTKVRNRMEGNMVNAIVLTRSSLANAGKCCFDFEINSDMLKGIGSTDIYDRQTVDGDAIDILEEDLFNW